MMDQTWRFVVLLLVGFMGLSPQSHGHYTSPEKNLQSSPSSETKVALLLPLSGPKASLGQSLMDAASLALFEGTSDHPLILYPFDADQPETLIEDIKTLNPTVIVGPVFSQETNDLFPKIPQSIPIFTLSNDPDLLGKGLFVMGISPFDESRFLLNFALQKGYKRFAALLPDTLFGHALEPILKEAISLQKGNALHILFYPLTEELCIETVAKWARQLNTFGPEAIFIPDSSSLTQKLIATLKFKDLRYKGLRFLGLSGWDKRGVFKDSTLRGLWIATNRSASLQDFQNRFQKTFQNPSTSLEALLYDTIHFIGSSPILTKEKLESHKIKGIYGLLKLKKNGAAIRPWHVLEHTGRGVKIIA